MSLEEHQGITWTRSLALIKDLDDLRTKGTIYLATRTSIKSLAFWISLQFLGQLAASSVTARFLVA